MCLASYEDGQINAKLSQKAVSNRNGVRRSSSCVFENGRKSTTPKPSCGALFFYKKTTTQISGQSAPATLQRDEEGVGRKF
eukprot:849947-Amphidinium_carterae.1